MNHKDTQSPIGHFVHNDNFYRHVIYCSDDDRVECLDKDNNVVLTFTADCYCYGNDKKLVGKWSMRNSKWEFTWEHNGSVSSFGTDLLASEMRVSEMYLRVQEGGNKLNKFIIHNKPTGNYFESDFAGWSWSSKKNAYKFDTYGSVQQCIKWLVQEHGCEESNLVVEEI